MPAEKHTSWIKTFLTIAISLLTAFFFMWLAVRNLDTENIKKAFLQADYWWILASFIVGVLAYWIRAVRWKILLKPMGYQISTNHSFWSLSFGYLINLTIPRSGEVARATALYGVEKVPVDKSFGTIILERIVDLLFMLFFIALAAIFKIDALKAFYVYITKSRSGSDNSPSLFWPILLIVMVSLLILFLVFKKRLKRTTFWHKVVGFGKGIVLGLKSFGQLKNKTGFVVYSFLLWFCYFLAAYLVCFALPQTSDFTVTDGIFVLVAGTLGMLIPASGGFGSFHLAMKLGFMGLFLAADKSPDVGADIGLSYAFLSHTLQIFIMLLMGLISIPVLAKARRILS